MGVPLAYLETKPGWTVDDDSVRAEIVDRLWYEVYGHSKGEGEGDKA